MRNCIIYIKKQFSHKYSVIKKQNKIQHRYLQSVDPFFIQLIVTYKIQKIITKK